ncbi:Exportin-T [Trichoplax sp. H2]|nr:Exportin-T [Trichoplax sp. H2]|eukprot:RDD43824.1 Exportin-T [Trichoplax sp. H2]
MDFQAIAALNQMSDLSIPSKEVIQELDRLKNSPQGWKLCGDSLVKRLYRYSSASYSDQQVLKEYLINWLRQWPSFFDDLLGFMSTGINAVDFYLRTLLAIDSEVVDRDIPHTPEELVRNTAIKDAMRIRCISDLVESWYQILQTYDSSQHELTCLCLQVDTLRESACDCIFEIMNKGMDAGEKIKLVESLVNVLDSCGIFASLGDIDADYAAKLGKLVNGIGTSLISSWTKLMRSGDVVAADQTLEMIDVKITLLLRFMTNEDDDVSQAVIGFAQSYVLLLKQLSPNELQRREDHLKGLLEAVISKYKYDQSYDFECEGEDEIMFLEYRKQLKNLFYNITQLNRELVLMVVYHYYVNIMSQWNSKAFMDIEVSIKILYMLGELIPGVHFTDDLNSASPIQQMMVMLITSGIDRHEHVAVLMQYFETVVRYDKFFVLHKQFIGPVLNAFLGTNGLQSTNLTLRSRSCYLLSRFIKQLRNSLDDYSENLLKQIRPHLSFESVNGQQKVLIDSDQLHLYEAAGIIVISGGLKVEERQFLMNCILTSLSNRFKDILSKIYNESDANQQFSYAQELNLIMSCASRVSKVFSSSQTMQDCGCSQYFIESLSVPSFKEQIQAGVRQFLHRMIICLGEQVLPFIPTAMNYLLKDPKPTDVQEFMPLINQVVSKFQRQVTPFLKESFMPIVNTIFAALNSTTDIADTQATKDKQLLHRSYFTFLSTLVTNDVASAILDQEVHNAQEVLLSLIHGCVDAGDLSSQKICFFVLHKLINAHDGNKSNLFGEFLYKNIIPACFIAPLKATFDFDDRQSLQVLSEIVTLQKSILNLEGQQFKEYLRTTYLPQLNLSADLIQAYVQGLEQMDMKSFNKYLKEFCMTLRTRLQDIR